MKKHFKPRLQQIGRSKRKPELMQNKANKIRNQLALKKNVSNKTLNIDELQTELSNYQERLAFIQNHAYELSLELDQMRDKQYRFKKLWIIRLLKPLIQLEKSLHSANRYRKKFRLLVREQKDIKKAYQYLFQYYKSHGFHQTKLFLRHYVKSQDILLEKEHHSRYDVQPVKFVEKTDVSLANFKKEVKVICFYLPQFHPFPENDKWWGTGFTEWTNVKPALPQYNGHYQPHIPHEDMGYYSLLDKDTQRKQIDLAKQYGIEGFCYYLYWFSGKRLMETPLDNMLADTTLDFPFCVCWANENWSRRWDGLDQDILIAQEYSDKDDIDFISHISKYLSDKRYIHIDGKPLLIIYRPNLFPNMKETVKRWRKWCLDNGIGEIYLAYPQSFEIKDPSEYDFDAAIEFPPNNSKPPMLQGKMNSAYSNFQGHIYDWRILLERSDNYTTSKYKLFRGVVPSWDNTARKKNKGIIFENSCPNLFEKYLVNAFSDTAIQKKHEDEKLVFVNAWNEWAEGAHLEPDQKYGYAWLQAIQNAHLILKKIREVTFGIVIHAFYPEILEEILMDLAWSKQFKSFKLYVTTSSDKEFVVNNILDKSGFEYEILVCENKGRDILPFLRILPKLREDNIQFFLKVHTKRSLHRQDGEDWRRYIYNQLLSKSGFISALYKFMATDNKKVGLVSPDHHVLSLLDYIGGNELALKALCDKYQVAFDENQIYHFIAGSMFYARMEVFDYIRDLDLESLKFDTENGQIDGTLAHVFERYFGILTISQGYSIQEINITDMRDRRHFF